MQSNIQKQTVWKWPAKMPVIEVLLFPISWGASLLGCTPEAASAAECDCLDEEDLKGDIRRALLGRSTRGGAVGVFDSMESTLRSVDKALWSWPPNLGRSGPRTGKTCERAEGLSWDSAAVFQSDRPINAKDAECGVIFWGNWSTLSFKAAIPLAWNLNY